MDEEIEPSLTRLRVLRLDELDRTKRLRQLWEYYDQAQNDYLEHDWNGFRRSPGLDYLTNRLDRNRYQPDPSIQYSYRRPICPTMLVGLVVDTYTSLLVGEGRVPSLRVVGDDASTELLEALFEHAGIWAALASARKIMGSVGAVAVVPEVIEGKPSLRVLRPEHLYVEWSNSSDWVPSLVIEQRLVRVESIDHDSGQVCDHKVWRTRAWTNKHVYVYQDVPERPADGDDGDDDPEQEIELAGPPQEHGCGRCPVVWIQNTHDPESPYGEPDCKPALEQVDGLDRLQSMLMRGGIANVDPTLLVSDKPQMLAKWPTRRKGHGATIEVSDHGDARFLEISGKSFEASWVTYEKIRRQIDVRVGVITIDPETAGSVLSGLAIRLLYRTQDTRAGARRVSLGKGIEQLGALWLALVREFGIKMVGEPGDGLELPPREVNSEASGEVSLERHAAGPGQALTLNWPGLHSATPQDVETTLRGLTVGTGGQAVISQESAVAVAVNLLETDTDVATELDRILGEQQRKVAAFDAAMAPDIEGDLFGADEPAADIEQVEAEPGMPVADGLAKGEPPPQQEARNGIQTKTMADTIARVGDDLSPEAAMFVIIDNYPTVDPAQVKAAIDSQLDFREKRRAELPDPPAVSPDQRAAGLAKAQAVQAGEEPEDGEDEREEDERE